MTFACLDFSPGVKLKSASLSQFAAEQALKVPLNFCKAFICSAHKCAGGICKSHNCKYLLW